MQVYLIIMLASLVTAFLAVRLYRFLVSREGLFTKEKLSHQARLKSYRRKPGGVPRSKGSTSSRKQTHGTPVVVAGNIQKPWGW